MDSLRIIVADDEALIRLDLKEMLEEAGHTVVAECQNGLLALEKTEELKPDLVIMDIKMPIMDGLVAAKEIRDKKIAPVILLTAFSQSHFIEKAKDHGVHGYLVKPVQIHQLIPAIEIAMGKFKEVQDLEDELDNLKLTIDTRKLLTRAKAILMETHGMSENEAYRRIQKYSMAKRKTMKEVAEAIIAAAKR